MQVFLTAIVDSAKGFLYNRSLGHGRYAPSINSVVCANINHRATAGGMKGIDVWLWTSRARGRLNMALTPSVNGNRILPPMYPPVTATIPK